MKVGFFLAAVVNLVVVLYFVALSVTYAIKVDGWINEYEAQGFRADNDLGQRGLAIIGLFSLLLISFALWSWLNLRLLKPAGFLLQSFIWLFVLVGTAMGLIPPAAKWMDWPTGRTWIQVVCLAAIALDLVLFTRSKLWIRNRNLQGT